jgi:hypothetical protein
VDDLEEAPYASQLPFLRSVGKMIVGLRLGDDDALHFMFDDGTGIKMFDDGQSCCESRYMLTDDKLEEHVGAKLIGAIIKTAGRVDTEEEYNVHEVQFLEIHTSNGYVTLSSHNEHNGYYGGISLVVKDEE